MSKLLTLKCPSCTANVYIEEGKKTCFCQSCGTQILLDDNTQTTVYKTVDVARITAETEKTKRQQLLMEHEKWQAKEIKKEQIRLFLLAIGVFILLYFAFRAVM